MKINRSILSKMIQESIKRHLLKEWNFFRSGKYTQYVYGHFCPADDKDVYPIISKLKDEGMYTPELDELCSTEYEFRATRVTSADPDTWDTPGYEETISGPEVDINYEKHILDAIQKITVLNQELGRAISNAWEKKKDNLERDYDWEDEEPNYPDYEPDNI